MKKAAIPKPDGSWSCRLVLNVDDEVLNEVIQKQGSIRSPQRRAEHLRRLIHLGRLVESGRLGQELSSEGPHILAPLLTGGAAQSVTLAAQEVNLSAPAATPNDPSRAAGQVDGAKVVGDVALESRPSESALKARNTLSQLTGRST